MSTSKNTLTVEITSPRQPLTEEELSELRADYAALGETEFNLKHQTAGIKARLTSHRTTVYGH